MDNKEFTYKGFVLNGFLALLMMLLLLAGTIYLFIIGPENDDLTVIPGVILLALFGLCCHGFIKQEPNEAKVLVFFGKYRGTFFRTGFYWVNPLMSKKSVSLRARNLNPDPIKVNDKSGNPVMIGMVLVWKLNDTYKALFEIDSQSLAPSAAGKGGSPRLSKTSSACRATPRSARLQAAIPMTTPTAPKP